MSTTNTPVVAPRHSQAFFLPNGWWLLPLVMFGLASWVAIIAAIIGLVG